jgi:PAS domain S-box-containing protein
MSEPKVPVSPLEPPPAPTPGEASEAAVSDRIDSPVTLQSAGGGDSELLRTLLSILPVGVVAYDMTTIRYANACALRLLGLSATPASPTEIFQYIHPDDWPVAERRRAARARGEETPPVELRLRQASGELVTVTVDTVELRGAPAPLFLTIIQDVTRQREHERDQREQEARRASEEAALRETQRLESLGMLAGGIAHDFNNLLANVYASLAAISRVAAPLAERQAFAPHIENAECAAARAADLTKQLLVYGGGASVARRPTSLSAVVHDLRGLLRVALSKSAVLSMHVAADLPPVSAEPAQLRQVVMNLVTTASEALGETPGRVTITTRHAKTLGPEHRALATQPTEAPNGWVLLEVEDDGPGVPDVARARIFEPFYSTKGVGRGLGLATTLGILRTHAARLSLDAGAAGGARFSGAFPALEGGAEPAATRGATSDAPTEGLTGTVLLVDDERRARFALGFLLKNRGFTVREAANGLEALEAVAAGVVDVVVMDLSMPRMGGREAFLQMRSRWPTLPVILTSGYGAAQLESLPFRDDLFAFLEKPFREEALVPLLFRALRRRG